MKNKLLFLIISAALIFAATACHDEIITPREYPRVNIIEEITQDGSQVSFKGEILTEGASAIIEKGFVWASHNRPNILTSRIISEGPNTPGTFSGCSNIDFVKGRTYYVSAFARTNDYVVYSDRVEFISEINSPAPVFDDFFPKQAASGDTITIEGEYLSFIYDEVNVYLDDIKTTLVSTTDTCMYFVVPYDIQQQELQVSFTLYGTTCTHPEKLMLNE